MTSAPRRAATLADLAPARFVLCIWATLLVAPQNAMGMSAPPAFVMDYAAKPENRWRGALRQATNGRSWDDTWGQIFEFHNKSLYSKLEEKHYDQLAAALDSHFPEQARELKGIVAEFAELFPHKHVSFGYLASWVYFHELAHTELNTLNSRTSRECTGLLAMDANEKVHHVANMDQSPANIRNVTLHVRFVNGTANLFEGVDWYWFTTGTSRMVMQDIASVQENWRHETLRFHEVFTDIISGVTPQIFIFRRAFESASQRLHAFDFEDLLKHMESIRLAAPFYVVMAGPQKRQGAIIARARRNVAGGGVLRFSEMSNKSLSSWALIQTNYDHWKSDSGEDPRRSVAEATIENLGRNGSMDLTLFSVASTFPVHNPTTAYTTVFNIAKGTLRAFVRTGLCPTQIESSLQGTRYDDYCRENQGGGGTEDHGDYKMNTFYIIVALTVGVILFTASTYLYVRAISVRRNSDQESLLLND